jgi:hypothetical protein
VSHPADPPAAAPRERNPRRVVLTELRHMKKVLTGLIVSWNVQTTVTLPSGGGNLRTRPRRPDEYPENSLMHWQDVLRTTRYVALQADTLANYAAEQIRRIEKETPDGQ